MLVYRVGEAKGFDLLLNGLANGEGGLIVIVFEPAYCFISIIVGIFEKQKQHRLRRKLYNFAQFI